jgi:hypothetical protein
MPRADRQAKAGVVIHALVAVLAVISPGSHPDLPWLHNLRDVVATDERDRFLTSALDEPDDPTCHHDTSQGLLLTAEVAPTAGPETIAASFSQGVTVLDREGLPIASTPGYPCFGSADDIEIVAVGTAFHTRTIVLAVTVGGRREQATWLAMFRVGQRGRLEPVFTTVVEHREDGIVRRGSVTILPDALLVRDPSGAVGFWTWDPTAGVYLPPAAYVDLDRAHS